MSGISGTPPTLVGTFNLTTDASRQVRVTSSWELRHAVIETRSQDGGVLQVFLNASDVSWLLAALDGKRESDDWCELTEGGRARARVVEPGHVEVCFRRLGRLVRLQLWRADVVRLRRALIAARDAWGGLCR